LFSEPSLTAIFSGGSDWSSSHELVVRDLIFSKLPVHAASKLEIQH
jgi:hypothetical protein